MAQRRSPAPKRPGGAAKGTANVSGRKNPPGRPPARKPGKSIVNQKQTPWGLIVTTAVIVVFAAGIVAFAVTRHKSSDSSGDRYTLPELAAAKQISGVVYKAEPDHEHVPGVISYNTSPPTGGNHSQYWADCTGTVYPQAIANENAVHMLEHGAVWITYKPGLAADQVATLEKYVKGQMWTAMSPYPDLKTNISLQAWNYQLFVDNANDPRIAEFLGLLRHNAQIIPEPGASCSQPTFIEHPSTPGHPLWVPASGASGGTMP